MPHFISAFTLSYVSLLDSLFTSFLFLPLLRHTYVILTLSTKPHSSSAAFPLFARRAVPPKPTDISISTFVALSNFHTTTLLHNYVPQRLLRPILLFFPLIPRLETIPSNFFLDQSFIHVCRFIRQTGRKAAGYYQDRCCKILAPCIFLRHPVRILRTVSPVDYPRLPFNPQSIPKLPR